jgi:hypothetical protein
MKTAAAAAVAAVAGWNSVAAKKGGSGGSGSTACANDPTVCTGGLVCCTSGKGSRCMSVDKCQGNPICPTGQQFCATTGACAECCADTDCPAPANECTAAACLNGVCGATNVTNTTPCSAGANATGACQNGTCELVSCSDGYGNCNGDTTDGCEIDLMTDENNCGTCGNVCGAYDVCRDGICASPCEPGMQIECSWTPDVVRCGDIEACATTVDGDAVCVQYGSYSAGCGTSCQSDADCSGLGGYRCVQYSCPDCAVATDNLCCEGGQHNLCAYVG